MAIINQSAVADARTTFETLATTALANARASGVWSSLSRKVTGTGSAHESILPGATPTWIEWTDEKDFGGARKLTRRTPLKKYHKSIEIPRTDVVYDPDGSTAALLDQFVGRDLEFLYDKLVLEKLSANPTGIDGVALIHDSHPYGSSTTWDNKTADALAFASFDVEVERMMALKDEHGEPLNMRPSVLIVATDIRREAKEIIGAEDRPVSIATSGAIGGVVGATGITNIYRAENWTLIETPIFTTGQWLIMDPRFKPIKLVEWRSPETIIVDDMTADARVRRDVFTYGAEADIVADGEQPWGIAGKL